MIQTRNNSTNSNHTYANQWRRLRTLVGNKLLPNYQVLDVTLDDGQIMPVIRVGNPNNPAVVLLHGYGMDAKSWLPFILPYCGTHCFYLPYLRGFYATAKSKATQDDILSDYADDVHAMRQQLVLDDITLIGFSMGALTSLNYAARYGFDGVNKYLHIDQSPIIRNQSDWHYGLFGNRQSEMFAAFKELAEITEPYLGLDYHQLPTPIQRRLITVGALFSQTATSRPVIRHTLHLLGQLGQRLPNVVNVDNWEFMRHGMLAYVNQNYDLMAAVDNITCPAHVFIAAKSELYSIEGQIKFAERFVNGDYTIFGQAGHAVILDQPITFIRQLGKFLHS